MRALRNGQPHPAMNRGRGDRAAQRRRRRIRSRISGCGICGVHGGCRTCARGAEIVAIHGYQHLSLVVDGSFVQADELDTDTTLGYGGAGLVLLLGSPYTGVVLAQVACGFRSLGSADAEIEACVRGDRWAPGVTIYTDSQDAPPAIAQRGIRAVYLAHGTRPKSHGVAHVMSVQGRCRDMPSDGGAAIEKAKRQLGMTRSQRRMSGVNLLLEAAAADPAFDGNFEALAERLGWTHGRLWRHNPTIHVAAKRWASQRATNVEPDRPDPNTEAEPMLSQPATGIP